MNNQRELTLMLEREQTELMNQIQLEFWQGLFCDLLKKHTLQNDFFLVNNNLTSEDVVAHIKGFLYDLGHIYGVEFTENMSSYRTEFNLRFFYYDNKKKKYDVISIVVCKNDITLRILPHSPLLKMFWLEEYMLVENILKELCEKLFDQGEQLHKNLLESYKRIVECTRDLNVKTIEIAQNSIRSLYNATNEKHKNLVQRNLYSSLLYNGKRIRIFHKEFLEDPNVLIKEFKLEE